MHYSPSTSGVYSIPELWSALLRDGTPFLAVVGSLISFFYVFNARSTNEATPYPWSLPERIDSAMLYGGNGPTSPFNSSLSSFYLSHSKM